MLISVIVSTYNRPDALAVVLAALGRQSDQHFEIIIADDGSDKATREAVQRWQKKLPCPLQHRWQEDKGFRAARARNNASSASSGEYLVFLDGDCIPRHRFIADHRAIAQAGWFVRGSRILLSQSFTRQVLSQSLPIGSWPWWRCLLARGHGHMRRVAPLLRPALPYVAYSKATSWYGAKTCNLAVFRNDFIAINGFDESYTGWGFEDSDLVTRLFDYGVRRKEAFNRAVVFHLYHSMHDKAESASKNYQLFMKTMHRRPFRAAHGLDAHHQRK